MSIERVDERITRLDELMTQAMIGAGVAIGSSTAAQDAWLPLIVDYLKIGPRSWRWNLQEGSASDQMGGEVVAESSFESTEVNDLFGVAADFLEHLKTKAMAERANDYRAADVDLDGKPDGVGAARRDDSVKISAEQSLPQEWKDVEIRFLSDLKFQAIVAGKSREPQNYADVGFGDGRQKNDKPKAAWETLRLLAESGGVIATTESATEWPKVEKRVQEIRKLLRAHFKIAADPVLYVGGAYRAQFKISLSASYET